jgi:hypothetical protein
MTALPVGFGSSGAYQISRSVRLRSSATAYFNRTFGTGSTQKYTFSTWFKRGTLGTAQYLIFTNRSFTTHVRLDVGNTIEIMTGDGAAVGSFSWITTQVFRDPSAWYHIVVAWDTTQATATNRLKVYINGIQITSFGTQQTITQNMGLGFNGGNILIGGSSYFDGYLSEINFVDGSQLTPSSFGENDLITGVWQPTKYVGTYGTNGFYLNFSDNSASTAAAIGKDYSGNGNNWTPNNISVTAGVTYDSMIDSPTSFPDGSTGRGNYAVLNPLKKPSTSTVASGNLNVTWAVAGGEQPASFALSSGKWYWEQTQSGTNAAPGIILDTAVPSASSISQGYHYYGNNGQFYTETSGVAYGATFTTSDVIGVALDLDNLQITFYKNNTSQGTKTIVAGSYTPDFASGGAVTVNANFGQRPFSYTPPSGFLALNTQNLPDATIKNGADYMAATLYTGTGASLSIVNTTGIESFQPDFIWIKSRSNALSHKLVNAVVGIQKALSSDSTAAEASDTGGVTAFNSDGFTIGTTLAYNTSAATYVAWQWNAGGSTVTNTSGSISAQVRANPTAGFSIVTYTGTGANATVGHGLGVAPSMYVCKTRSGVNGWIMYHVSTGNTKFMTLNDQVAAQTAATVWNSTTPTSSVFSLGSSGGVNNSASTYVAYCFAAVAGYSAFGSYTGNGSADGPFVFTGFRPRFVLFKNTIASQWILLDTSRSTYNVSNAYLEPNTSDVENSANTVFDFLSNGFKLRNAAGTDYNASGNTYIYMAFAENPFKYSLAR